MRNILLLLFLFVAAMSVADTIPVDELKLGSISTNDKKLVFNINNASFPNPELNAPQDGDQMNLTVDSVKLGSASTDDKFLVFEINNASFPDTSLKAPQSGDELVANVDLFTVGSTTTDSKLLKFDVSGTDPLFTAPDAGDQLELNVDQFFQGDGTATLKEFMFNTGVAVASMPAIIYDPAGAGDVKLRTNNLVFGEGFQNTMEIKFDNGMSNVSMPAIRWNGTSMQVTNDFGASYEDIPGAGGGGGFPDPMTTAGDIIIRNAGNTTTRLAIGSASDVLTVTGGVPVWAAPAGGGGGGNVILEAAGNYRICTVFYRTASAIVDLDMGNCYTTIAKNTTGDVTIQFDGTEVTGPVYCGQCADIAASSDRSCSVRQVSLGSGVRWANITASTGAAVECDGTNGCTGICIAKEN
jgi:hypothetical protein